MKTIRLIFSLLWFAVVVAIPVLAVWLSSSLVAYLDGPRWAPLVAGLLLFPALPLAWEAFATLRRKQKGATGERFLKTGDRITLRVLTISLLFLGALVGLYPAASFEALSARGDWFLEGSEAPAATKARELVFATAGALEAVHRWARPNPYDDGKGTKVTPDGEGGALAAADDAAPACAPGNKDCVPRWPLSEEVHPIVREMPSTVEASIQAVGEYIRANEPNPYFRVKALHDWAADRVAYDVVSLEPGKRAPQDAETVFRTRKAVCEGYARLMVALGQASGDEIVYVVGHTRELDGALAGVGHAWNAAKIDGRWYLLDATWDAGFINGSQFNREYRSTYLLIPPKVMGLNHIPDDESWQLRDTPISRGDFVRQPVLTPDFQMAGLVMQEPQRSQIEVESTAVVKLANPLRRKVIATVNELGADGAELSRCEVTGEGTTTITCRMPGAGRYSVRLFSSEPGESTFGYIGRVEVVSRAGAPAAG